MDLPKPRQLKQKHTHTQNGGESRILSQALPKTQDGHLSLRLENKVAPINIPGNLVSSIVSILNFTISC